MSDAITKIQDAINLIQDEQTSALQRVRRCLMTLSDVNLASISPEEARTLEKQIDAMKVLEAKTGDDDASNSAVQQMSGQIQSLLQIQLNIEIARTMEAFATAGRKLPVEAIKAVRQHRTLFIPHLTKALRNAIELVRNGEKLPTDDASFFAILLLTELEAEESYPTLVDMFRLPGRQAEDVFGDGAYELAAPILAQCCRDDATAIHEIVGDSEIDIFQRWSVAHTYKFLVRDGVIERQQAIDSLLLHFQSSSAGEDSRMLAALACELAEFAAEEALEPIRAACQAGRLDESLAKLHFIESKIAASEKTFRDTLAGCRSSGMPDTIAELSGWAAFREAPTVRRGAAPAAPQPQASPTESVRLHAGEPARVGAKTRRNDPCPCGSGKKFKKCCR